MQKPDFPGYGRGFTYRRVCHVCRTHKHMAGGATSRDGKRWVCKDCRKPKA